MKTRELITKLLYCDLDAEISIDADVVDDLTGDDGMKIGNVKRQDSQFGNYAVIVMEKL